jgi:hypothetical protein
MPSRRPGGRQVPACCNSTTPHLPKRSILERHWNGASSSQSDIRNWLSSTIAIGAEDKAPGTSVPQPVDALYLEAIQTRA